MSSDEMDEIKEEPVKKVKVIKVRFIRLQNMSDIQNKCMSIFSGGEDAEQKL